LKAANQEMASSSEEFNAQAETLNNNIDELTKMVKGISLKPGNYGKSFKQVKHKTKSMCYNHILKQQEGNGD
jgi:phage host-nuclease inhibitor protein Gam